MVDMESQGVRESTDRDIMNYTSNELRTKAERYQEPVVADSGAEPSKSAVILQNLESLSAEITTKANGMFVWAVIALPDIILRFMSSNMEYDELVSSISQLPERMDDMFTYLLSRITHADNGLGRAESLKRRRHLLILLRWAFHAVRPLTLKELQAAITLELPNATDNQLEISTGEHANMEFLSDLARAAYPLIVVEDEKLTVLHSSFRDFVNPSSGQTFSSITEALGTTSLLDNFITLTIGYLPSDVFDFEEHITDENSVISSAHPFYDYACISWVSQSQNLKLLPRPLQDQVARFLTSESAITWLEQWQFVSRGSIRSVQSAVYAAFDSIQDPKWCIALLARCCQLRSWEDDDSVPTLEARRSLGLAYNDIGMLDDALQQSRMILDKRQEEPSSQDFDFFVLETDIAGIYKQQGKYQEATQMYRVIASRYEAEKGELALETLMAQCHLGGCLIDSGHLTEAEALLEDVYKKQLKVFGERSSATLNTLNTFVISLLAQGKFQVAKEQALEARRLYLQIEDATGAGVLLIESHIAVAEAGLGHYKAAVEMERKVLAMETAKYGPEHPRVLIVRNNLAHSLNRLGNHDEALEIFTDIYEKRKRFVGDNNLDTLHVAANLAAQLSGKGRFEEAVPLEEYVLAQRNEQLGPKHHRTLFSTHNLALSYNSVGRWKEARVLLADAYEGFVAVLGDNHDSALQCLATLASACNHCSSTVLASWLANLRMEMTENVYGETHPNYIEALDCRGIYERMNGDFAAAVASAKQASNLYKAHSGKNYHRTLSALVHLATSLRNDGYYEQAEVVLEGVLHKHRTSLSPDHTARLDTERELALVHYEQERFDTAVAELKKLQREAPTYFTENSNFRIGLHISLAQVLSALGEYDDAEVVARKATVSTAECGGDRSQFTAFAMEIMAKALVGQSRLEEARHLLINAADIRFEKAGTHHPFTLTTIESLSRALEKEGLHSDAAYLMQIVVDRRQQILRKGHPVLLKSQVRLKDKLDKLATAPAVHDPDVARLLQMDKPQPPAALARLEQAKNCLGPSHILTLRASLAVGIFYKNNGRVEEAEEYLLATLDSQAMSLGADARSPYTLKVMAELGQASSKFLRNSKMLQCLHQALDLNDASLLRQLLHAGADTTRKTKRRNSAFLAMPLRPKTWN